MLIDTLDSTVCFELLNSRLLCQLLLLFHSFYLQFLTDRSYYLLIKNGTEIFTRSQIFLSYAFSTAHFTTFVDKVSLNPTYAQDLLWISYDPFVDKDNPYPQKVLLIYNVYNVLYTCLLTILFIMSTSTLRPTSSQPKENTPKTPRKIYPCPPYSPSVSASSSSESSPPSPNAQLKRDPDSGQAPKKRTRCITPYVFRRVEFICHAPTSHGYCRRPVSKCPYAKHHAPDPTSSVFKPCPKHPRFTILSCRKCQHTRLRKAYFA